MIINRVFTVVCMVFCSSILFGQNVLYCKVLGNGDYNLSKLSSREAVENIDYYGERPESGYKYFKAGRLVVEKGSNFTLMVMHSNTWSRTELWIDWNGDGDFKDIGEALKTFGLVKQKNQTPIELVIEVPKNAKRGITRMRVQTIDAWAEYYAPCGEVWNSSTKDFDIEIKKIK